jgi:RNA-directed DNA polymerase
MLKRRKHRVDDWYVKKSFAHFDLPLSYDNALAKVQNTQFVIERPFWPMIGFVDSKRKFGKQAGKRFVSKKNRPLRFCSHIDGYIHSFYRKKIIPKYEQFLAENDLSDVVIGYRKGKGTNVDMAKSAFDEINRRSSCSVIALDISSFFESIDHHVLKKNLCKILSEDRLPLDWFKIYKSMTQYSWVELSDLADRLGFLQDNPPRPICSAETYRKVIRGGDGEHTNLVNRRRERFGIPQGSPLSAIFSNIYMAEFDLICARHFATLDVFYRRYSDDIIIIGTREETKNALDFINTEMAKLGPSMKINDDKTEISEFERLALGVFKCDRPITYLGLTYDGMRVTLRGRTLSRYYRRMTYAARQAIRSAKKSDSGKIFLRGIYREFTHLGRQNFYTYARTASAILRDESPLRQLRRHFRILHRKLRSAGR